jgi:integrative and conjugative element protein (TIGR02256 family)
MPQQNDRCSAFSFKRAVSGHQEIMDSLWEASNHMKTYLGEWHTHRELIPHPSGIDKKNWLEISRRKQNSNWLFFIIVGKSQIRVWTVVNGTIIQMEKQG